MLLKTIHAIRILILLGKSDRPITRTEVERLKDFPKGMNNIFASLARAELISNKKGVSGGFYLKKDPKDIMIANVIFFIEGPNNIMPCMDSGIEKTCDGCFDKAFCGIRLLLIQQQKEALEIFSISLETLMENEEKLKDLLTMAAN